LRSVLRRAVAAGALAMLGVSLPFIGGSAGQAAPAAHRGGTLVYAAAGDVDNFDPALRGGTISAAAKDLVYGSLVKELPTQAIVPDLAVSWKADGTVWTVALRRGVKFQDGTPFTAQAVKDHYDRLLTQNLQRSSDWRGSLDRVEAPDDYTVRFHTKFPDPYFLQQMAASSQIESPDAVKKYGRDLARNPVGTGPFRLKEWTPDVRIVLVRHDDYWGDKSYLDQVVIRPVPEAGARAIALESGDVQLADLISPEDMPRLRRDPGVVVLDAKPTTRQLAVGMNNTKPPFTDLRVRQALNYAVWGRQSPAQCPGRIRPTLDTIYNPRWGPSFTSRGTESSAAGPPIPCSYTGVYGFR